MEKNNIFYFLFLGVNKNLLYTVILLQKLLLVMFISSSFLK